jgi:phage terminase large subunit-like protein
MSGAPADIAGYDPISTAGACVYDDARASEPIEFAAECLTHVKGEWGGQPFLFEQWQQDIIRTLFGWLRPDGTRRYREAFIYVPRKNGKTSMIGAIADYVLFCDGEPGAECYCCAADKEQASLAYQQSAGMIRNEQELSSRCKEYTATKRIVVPATNSFLTVVSPDANSKHGYNAHLVVLDEVHALGRNNDLIEVLETSMGSRRQPLMIMITTADFKRPSVCNERLEYARKVRDGIIEDEAFLPVIYETADAEADWASEEVWRACNPNYGISLKPEYLHAKAQKAREQPSLENAFKRLHLNMQTEQDQRWLQMATWDACAEYAGDLTGEMCHAGLDLATTTDIAAFVAIFPECGNAVLPMFWLPDGCVRKAAGENLTQYRQWIGDGLIRTTPGDVVDYEQIRADIVEFSRQYRLVDVGFDPWNATNIATNLHERDGIRMFEFRQGAVSMNEPCRELERLVVAGELAHNAHPILRWMASNVAIKTSPDGLIRPDKQKSAQKIDGIVALVMALGRSMIATDTGPSVYSERGILTL